MTSPYALERYFTAHRLPLLGAIVCALALAIPPAWGEEFHKPDGRQVFQHIATFPDPEETQNATEIAEIVSASEDGSLLIYTDSMTGNLGFVDIVDPRDPKAGGVLGMSGAPTSVAVAGPYALAAVNTSESFLDPSGELVVVDIESRSIVRRIDLGGQPDSVAVSPDGHFAAVAIENRRDEDVNGGAMPQSPPGFLTIVDTVGTPSAWTTRDVVLVGFSDRFPTDPEPEFVDINANNRAAVTLQENNHVVIVDLPSGTVVRDWPTGTTSHLADLEDDGQIVFDDRLRDARREPDAIVWTRHNNLLTANEGDYDLDLGPGEFVGGRNFSIFTRAGDIVFDGGVQLERRIAQAGRYDDTRSDDKGCEIEGAEVARYDGRDFAFLGAERCASVAVYRIDDQSAPDFIQILILPTDSRPEGLLAIPDRSLFVSANEGDGTISIFQRQQ
jgi:DNA-binding beta-propeller fold protein YncE